MAALPGTPRLYLFAAFGRCLQAALPVAGIATHCRGNSMESRQVARQRESAIMAGKGKDDPGHSVPGRNEPAHSPASYVLTVGCRQEQGGQRGGHWATLTLADTGPVHHPDEGGAVLAVSGNAVLRRAEDVATVLLHLQGMRCSYT